MADCGTVMVCELSTQNLLQLPEYILHFLNFFKGLLHIKLFLMLNTELCQFMLVYDVSTDVCTQLCVKLFVCACLVKPNDNHDKNR